MARDNFQQRGYSLIELVVTVVIIGILAGIAYPNYARMVQESRRTDARAALTEGAARQERLFSETSSYTDDVTRIMLNGTDSDDGHYAMTLSNPGCANTVGGTTTYTCFTLTATAQGAQANDTDCQTLSINEIGQRTATGGGQCW